MSIINFKRAIPFCIALICQSVDAFDSFELRPVASHLSIQQALKVELVLASNYGNGLNIELHRKPFNLDLVTERLAFRNEVLSLIELANLQKQEEKKSIHSENFSIGSDIRKSLQLILVKLDELERNIEDFNENLDICLPCKQNADFLLSLTESINYNYRFTVLSNIQLAEFWKIIRGQLSSRVGKYPKKDLNLYPLNEVSTFWKKQDDVTSLDLKVGFDRKKILDFDKVDFEYKKPKKGYGTHPGFRLNYQGDEYKIRIGDEARVAPFANRIIWALGYNALPLDYAKSIRIKYTPKIIREYNSRKEFKTKVKLLIFKIFERNNQRFHDPFKNIISATLKNGQKLSSNELRKNLMKSEDSKSVLNEEAFNTEFEEQIESIEFGPVSVEKLDKKAVSVGPWSWSAPQQVQRQELRGYGLIAAWLGQYDARTENTRLYIYENKKGEQVLRHVISDVGSGLGGASGILNFRKDNLNRFKSRVLRKHPIYQDQVQSVNFRTISRNLTFEAMTKEDAKWALSLIDTLSELQIREALEVSGFSSDEVSLATHLLIKRRENIRRVLD